MDDRNSRKGPGRVWAGLFLLLIGGILLLDQMGFPLPDWLFNWHVLLIAVGIFIGLRHNFRGGGWLILIAVGSVYLAQDYYPDIHIHRFIWPGILICVGLMIILRPGRHHYRHEWRAHRHEWRAEMGRRGGRWGRQYPGERAGGENIETGGSSTTFSSSTRESYSSDDYIDTTSIFGGIHKKIVSKNFKGGDITTMLGGTEIDLTQADFTGTIRLDVTQIMGGTKIIVPPHWEVRSEVTAVFAGFEDKRQQPAMTNAEKVLIIDGTSIFGGIELKNY
jgi:hypothetical protein